MHITTQAIKINLTISPRAISTILIVRLSMMLAGSAFKIFVHYLPLSPYFDYCP